MAESEFSKLQKDVCDVPKPEPIKKICPTCVPNPNFMEPDWRQAVGRSYLNEKTCEYMVCVTLNKLGDSFVASSSNKFPSDQTAAERTTRRKLLRSYVESGLRIILEDNGKLIADQILCAYHNGPALDFLPEEILTTYQDFDSAYFALSMDPAETGKGACREIDLPLSPALNPQEPVNFMATIIQTNGRLPQIKNPFALEIYGYPKEFTFVEGEGGLLKVLVAAPAYIIDRVPDNPIRDEIEAEAEKVQEEVIITVENFFGQIQRLRSALWVYSQYQSAFHQLQKGYLYQTEGEDKVDYYASVYAKDVIDLYKNLKQVAKKNGWNIKSKLKSAIRNNARLIKITFDQSDPDNPYKILKIEAKKRGCPYEEWTKGLHLLKGKGSLGKFVDSSPFDKTTWNYLAKINEIDVALQARQSYPWLDFLIKFTYPLIHVDYGRFSKKKLEKQGLGCIADQAKEFLVELRDYMLNESLSISDIVSYEYNKKGCADFGDLSEEHEVKVIEDAKASRREELKAYKQEGREVRKQQDERTINRLENEKSSLVNENRMLQNKLDTMDFSVKFVGPTEIDGMLKQIQSNEDRIKEIDNRVKKLGTKRRQRKAGRHSRRHAKKIGLVDDPYYKEVIQTSLEEFVTQDSLLASLVDKETFLESGKLTFKSMEPIDLSDLLSRMTICNLQSLVIQATRCLMSGVTIESAFRKIIKASLEAMDLDVFGIFIQNLPADAQAKLRAAYEKEFSDLPLPWEQGYDAGAIENTNAYLKYLKKPTPPLEEQQEEEEPTIPKPEPLPKGDVPLEEVIKRKPGPRTGCSSNSGGDYNC